MDWVFDPALRTESLTLCSFYGYTLCLVGRYQDILFVLFVVPDSYPTWSLWKG